MDVEKKLQNLLPFYQVYKNASSFEEKKALLLGHPSTKKALENPRIKKIHPTLAREEIVFLTLLALDQELLVLGIDLFEDLAKVEIFYEAMGGLLGYYVTLLQLICAQEVKEKRNYLSPPLFDVSQKTNEVKKAVKRGLESLPQIAEIYPIGGLGDRLNLRGEANEPLPTATLLFCGRTLLEGLVRDVSAREYLYYKLFSKEIFIPIAMMTSHEKDNDRLILEICEKNHWFNRPKSSFRLFSQISVPVITKQGEFAMRSTSQINLQPGGHGALWRTAEEKGIFEWLESLKKEKIVIRQINNPIAGLDNGLLTLIGKSVEDDRVFGFASCKRAPNAAEGVLVATKDSRGYFAISNIEYTDFKRYGILDVEDEEGNSLYPANTNILYVNLPRLLPYLKENPFPGIVLNMKSDVQTIRGDTVKGGRLESTMQSISDSLIEKDLDNVPTCLTYNDRLKTISTTKQSYEEGKSLLETPLGAFYDLMLNAVDLLIKECGVEIAPLNSPKDYIAHGPTLLFLYHPALGPLYEVICQKIRGGKFHKNSELQLEITELYLENLNCDGSLFVQAKNLMGELKEGILHYGKETGKCYLRNVTIKNKGIKREDQPLYWKNGHTHHERLLITLEGCSEFHAEDITFVGDLEILVPHNERWTACMDHGKLVFQKEKISGPTWEWEYHLTADAIKLSMGHLLDAHHTTS